jgi:3-hydroxyisobutyrate dehydrogenase-like beta-hydroxyacid dehydrogenase
MRIGFIGLGTMGGAVAANLLHAGHQVTVWNRSPAKAEPLVAQGAVLAADAAGALRGDLLLSMLATEHAIAEIGLDGALLAHASKDLVHVNLATVSTEFARRIAGNHAARGVGYVASPVFGRAEAAAAGKLTVVAAGDEASVAKARPVLEAIGQRLVVVGSSPEQANLFKIAGNFMLASVIEMMGEALALVRKGGIDGNLFYQVMSGSLFAAPVFQGYGALIVAEKFEPAGFSLRLGLKDVSLALTSSAELTVPMPLASLLRDQFIEAMAHGLSEKDWVSLASLIAVKAGLPSNEPALQRS